MTCARLTNIAVALLFTAIPASAGDWPQFRGPQSNGLTPVLELPTSWSADENLSWSVEIPGAGWASPIIWEDRVFISTAVLDPATAPKNTRRLDDDEEGDDGEEEEEEEEEPREPPTTVYSWELYSLDRETGEVLWKKVAHEGNPPHHTHEANTYATETPVTDGEHVYVYFGMVGVFCYDLQGNLIWEKEMESVPMLYDFGTASSPALGDNNIFLQIDNEDDSYIIALDKKPPTGAAPSSGKTANEPNSSPPDKPHALTTPPQETSSGH
jgi:outer membrane protein assembly factor BamB